MIFAGKYRNKVVELVVDPFAEEVGVDTYMDYILKKQRAREKLSRRYYS